MHSEFFYIFNFSFPETSGENSSDICYDSRTMAEENEKKSTTCPVRGLPANASAIMAVFCRK